MDVHEKAVAFPISTCINEFPVSETSTYHVLVLLFFFPPQDHVRFFQGAIDVLFEATIFPDLGVRLER